MPEFRRIFECLPLARIRGRDGVTDVAAEGLPGGVMRGAHLAAIDVGDRDVKTCIERADVIGVQVSRGTQDTVWHG